MGHERAPWPTLGALDPVCYRELNPLPWRVTKGFGMSASDPSATAAMPTSLFSASLSEADPEVFEAVRRELGRQRDEIELIASENIVSRAVLEAQGSILTNKYAEGLPGRRYYGGCQYVDIAERLAIERVTKLFG